MIEDGRRRLEDAARRGLDIGPAGDWLLDNIYVVREHAEQVRESMPVRYFRELPITTAGALAEHPRIYELALTLISHAEGRIDINEVEAFVAAFQTVEPLLLGELWALPSMLRLGLLETIRRSTMRTLDRLVQLEAADDWARRILRQGVEDSSRMHAALAAFAAAEPSPAPVLVSRLLQQLRAAEGAFPLLTAFERWLADEGIDPTDAASRAAQRGALTAHALSNSILSLRSLAPLDWHGFVERQSAVERTLREDPAATYAQMTFETRDAYRHVVERLAQGSRHSEFEVARRVVALATSADEPRRRHVGYWLVDAGVSDCERHLGYMPPLGLRIRRMLLRHPNTVLFSGAAALLVAAAAAALLLGGAPPARSWVLVLAVTLLPASEIAVQLLSQLVARLLPPRRLAALDFSESGIPPEHRSAVVVPILLPSVAAAEEALSSLEVQFLANRTSGLHFVLLSDLPDAATAEQPGDAAIVEAAAAGVRALNARYAATTQDAFILLHRPRRWNPAEGVWMGWERKRGKLTEFNALVTRGDLAPFSARAGNVECLRGVRYAITLDADTRMPPGSALKLVGCIAHPLNRAVVDPVHRIVEHGYAILQPSIGVALESARRSRFAATMSQRPGVDPYHIAASDLYQDLFGEGSFTGKGIYDIAAFEAATAGRFPENTLLSHDLIEGNHARAGLLTDVILYDDFPGHHRAYERRRHRWIRGDWQLLPWLGRTVPGSVGRRRNALSPLGRWKVLDNLRRSLHEPALLAFLVAGWTVLPGSPLRWTTLALLALAAPWIIALLFAALEPPRREPRRPHYRALASDARTAARQVGVALLFLPQHTVLAVDAIVRTLWRLAISRRHLLQWTAAAEVERQRLGGRHGAWRSMWPAAVLPAATVLAILAWQLGDADLAQPIAMAGVMGALALLWLLAPYLARYLDAPPTQRREPLSAAQTQDARRYARAHWEYFARYVDATTAWLAPDNVQEIPQEAVAMRTSPTNIGLQLLSTVSAYDLRLIPLKEMTTRLERALETMMRMPRHRGHFYNWYELPSLAVLPPGYVSSVDSGNLAGHLLALRQACRALAGVDAVAVGDLGDQGDLDARLSAVADLAGRLVEEMDFHFLFDEDRSLFTVGFTTETSQRDASTYDLLASEARLASFVAIAKGEVPPEHWFHLGRALTRAGGEAALISWSGSLFEYLMPHLVMHALPGTLLRYSYEGALRRHEAYAAAHGVPWGISESAYNVRDRHFTYQYRAFGVPDLALQRGLGRELVVAPYASVLAAQLVPAAALRNLRALEGLGALGPLGFYDALDYTRPDPGQDFALVRCQMAHHVGMSLVALANVLCDDCWPRRFHADPMVRSAALLLDERVPRRLVFHRPQVSFVEEARPAETRPGPLSRIIEGRDHGRPHVALLGTASFTTILTDAGSGGSRCEGLAVTRWQPDETREHQGLFVYIHDLLEDRVWSAAAQPVELRADRYRVDLANDRATFEREDGAIRTRMEVVVVPDDAAEIRRITITNHSGQVRELDVTSYGEPVLAPHAADQAHRAFSNLFVETDWHAWCETITARRRPRRADEDPIWCAHIVDEGEQRIGAASCETDRARFLGRGRSTRDPIALTRSGPLSGTTGAVLDPAFAIRVRLRLAPGASGSVAFTTLLSRDRTRLLELADRYHATRSVERALDLSWTTARIELQELGITPAMASLCQDFAGHVLFPAGVPRPRTPRGTHPGGGQQVLWSHGISGDLPILLARLDGRDGLSTLEGLLQAHRYWRFRGVAADLVVVCGEPRGYQQDLRERAVELAVASGSAGVLGGRGGVHVHNRGGIGADLETLESIARIVVPCDGRSLRRVLRELERDDAVGRRVPALRRSRPIPRPTATPATPESLDVATAARRTPLRFANGFGGLTEDDHYRILVRGDHLPPAPWVNVIANPSGGCLVSERGVGCVWAGSSHGFRLTPWHNDPVTDDPGEFLCLRDEDSGLAWCATPGPMRSTLPYEVEHAAGSTTFRHRRDGICTRLRVGMAEAHAVHLAILRVTNETGRRRRLTVTAYVEWVLGGLRELTRHRVQTHFDEARSAILAQNTFEGPHAEAVAFAALNLPVQSHSGDRREFLGHCGSPAAPAGLACERLDDRTGRGLDPCAALRSLLTLDPGQSHTVVLLVGAGASEEQALALLDAHRRASSATAALDAGVAAWRARLDALRVQTPEPALDALLNHWAPYQVLSSRMWARTALYQSSGAYGFRDQLQDAMALVYAEPSITRAHLLRAASRQYVEGDVQHWWHPDTGRGIRTRSSDDLLWLPHAVEHYVRVTGDVSVLEERLPFLSSPPLAEAEHDRYELVAPGEDPADLFTHCARALARGATRGPHGLPLMAGGDWNDGMDRVGIGGSGESVWLAWFLIDTLRRFAPLAEARHEAGVAAGWRATADAYAAAVESQGWDGAWYRRAFYDDGTPLGTAEDSECRIDAIAQSWSVIADAGDPTRQRAAMQAVAEQLVDQDARLIRLLTPPFDAGPRDPGYIKGYVPGVRENGAQYTHAAAWAVLAAARLGDAERALAWYRMLLPLLHADTAEAAKTYRVEPYVVAADVYTADGQRGRGGWTWYTGAAGWLYRVGIEELLGFRLRGERLTIRPCLPDAWPSYSIAYRKGSSHYAITVEQPGRIRTAGAQVEIDGQRVDDDTIPLVADGRAHRVRVTARD